MFDCHAHLCCSEFQEKLPDIIERAKASNVTGVCCVSEDMNDAQRVMDISNTIGKDFVFPAIGMHPEKADLDKLQDVLNFIHENHEKLIAIGECGLDYSPHIIGENNNEEELKKVQQEVLKQQIIIANEYKLPLNIHSRQAGHHTISFLEEHGATSGVVMHAFDGKAHYAELAASKLGYFFSVPPCIVRSPSLQKMVKRLPIEKLLLETDSPALAAEKGEINEPQHLKIAAECIANIKGLHIEEVIEITSHNTKNLMPKAFI